MLKLGPDGPAEEGLVARGWDPSPAYLASSNTQEKRSGPREAAEARLGCSNCVGLLKNVESPMLGAAARLSWKKTPTEGVKWLSTSSLVDPVQTSSIGRIGVPSNTNGKMAEQDSGIARKRRQERRKIEVMQ